MPFFVLASMEDTDLAWGESARYSKPDVLLQSLLRAMVWLVRVEQIWKTICSTVTNKDQ